MVHHACLLVPRRVSERFRQAASYPAYLPIHEVLPSYLIHGLRDEYVWLLTLVKLTLQHVLEVLGAHIGNDDGEPSQMEVVGPLHSLAGLAVFAEPAQVLLNIWCAPVIDPREPTNSACIPLHSSLYYFFLFL